VKHNDTLRDAAGAHDTDPTAAPISEATEPGPPPESDEVDNILDGFGGRPRTYYAKHQPGSDGRSAAKYDAVASPVRAHTEPREMAPVILATTAELPLGRLLQEASRADEARVTVPILRAVPTPPQASTPQPNPRNQTTTPGMRPRRSSAGWLVPAIVVAVLVVGAALYLTRGPGGASAPQATSATGHAAATPSATMPAAATPSASAVAEAASVGGATSVSKVVSAAPSSSVPPAPTSATMPVLSATTVAVAPPPTAPAPTSLPTRPGHSARSPETAPPPSVAPAPSPPRGDMKRNFE
jgi:hypothetical protein